MIVYKIDSIHRKVILKDGRFQKSNQKTEFEYDLPNCNTYKENGELVSLANIEEYDYQLCRKLVRVNPIHKIEDLLEYQFSNSPDKQEFLKHVRGVAIRQTIFKEKENKTMAAWLRYFNEWVNVKMANSMNTDNLTSEPKDKLTHKQQILLLKQIGFFDLPVFNELSTVKKGKLVSHLLNRTEKVSLEIVRGLNGKPDKSYKVDTADNIKQVNNLLLELDLKEYLVK